VQDYGFCGFAEIKGNFGTHTAGGDTAAQILALNGHWQLQMTFPHNGDPITGQWNCARQSYFSPAGNFPGIWGNQEVDTSVSNPDSQTIPSSGHYVCPWTEMLGEAAGSNCWGSGNYAANLFGVNPTSGANNEHVTRFVGSGSCTTSRLKTGSNCTNTTNAIAYGTAHPGNTSGWEYTMASGVGTAGSHDLGAVVSDTLCYITEWDNQGWHLLNDLHGYDDIYLSQSGGSPNDWVINKNYDYQTVKVTCIPYDQSP
jgi:hypothetical protein